MVKETVIIESYGYFVNNSFITTNIPIKDKNTTYIIPFTNRKDMLSNLDKLHSHLAKEDSMHRNKILDLYIDLYNLK